MKQSKPNVYAFIDSQNLNLGVQKMGWKMDWRKFRKYLADKYGVNKAYMFIGHVPEFEDMYVHMHELGFLVVLKPTSDMSKVPVENKEEDRSADKTEDKKPVKGNIDAELVLWAMKELKDYDKAIIVSGDGDFYCLAEYLEEIGKLGHIMTPNWQYSGLLKRFEKYIIRIDQLRRELSYHSSRRPKAKSK
ncbi:MAG TPA: NYN domain-containing protein [Candidatus Saccharimonadales bacterium]|nr:NYN domain-containing protein [Candidatus Saccharimonadales bacterium]